jgi:hypothetical protein
LALLASRNRLGLWGWRLLEGVSSDQVRELLQIAPRRRFARNEVVFRRDDPGDALHLIISIRVIDRESGAPSGTAARHDPAPARQDTGARLGGAGEAREISGRQ